MGHIEASTLLGEQGLPSSVPGRAWVSSSLLCLRAIPRSSATLRPWELPCSGCARPHAPCPRMGEPGKSGSQVPLLTGAAPLRDLSCHGFHLYSHPCPGLLRVGHVGPPPHCCRPQGSWLHPHCWCYTFFLRVYLFI